MALATTCPQCQTSFKVVPDQLKLRKGLVRCGVCQHVFSGIDNLRYVSEPRTAPRAAAAPPGGESPDLKTAFFLPETVIGEQRADARRVGPGPSPHRPEPPPRVGPAPPADTPVRQAGDAPAEDATLDDEAARQARSGRRLDDHEAGHAHADGAGDRVDHDADDRVDLARDHDTGLAHDSGHDRHADPAHDTGHGLHTSQGREGGRDVDVAGDRRGGRSDGPKRRRRDRKDDAAIVAHPDRPDEFLEDFGSAFARPRARTASRASQRRLAVAVVALAILLALQLALGSRDLLAARIPAMRPMLSALGAPLGLGIELPRLPGKLTIESFELAGAGPAGVYKLDAVLRNRASHPVQWPAIELTLTDAFGGVVASKVLLPSDYHDGQRREEGFPGNAEESVSLEIAIDEVVPSGYRAILFYP